MPEQEKQFVELYVSFSISNIDTKQTINLSTVLKVRESFCVQPANDDAENQMPSLIALLGQTVTNELGDEYANWGLVVLNIMMNNYRIEIPEIPALLMEAPIQVPSL